MLPILILFKETIDDLVITVNVHINLPSTLRPSGIPLYSHLHFLPRFLQLAREVYSPLQDQARIMLSNLLFLAAETDGRCTWIFKDISEQNQPYPRCSSHSMNLS